MNVLSFLISFMMVGVFITFIAESVWLFISGVVLLSAAFFSSHSIILAWVSARTSSAKGQATSFYLLSYYSGGAVMGYVNGWLFAIQGGAVWRYPVLLCWALGL
jgi:MFS family permease